MYTVLKQHDRVVGIRHEETGTILPLDPANTDYQQYLTWKSTFQGTVPIVEDYKGE